MPKSMKVDTRTVRRKVTDMEKRIEAMEKETAKHMERESKRVSLAGKVKPFDVIVFDDRTHWHAIHVEAWGAYLVKLPYKTQPVLGDAPFFTWLDIQKKGGTLKGGGAA